MYGVLAKNPTGGMLLSDETPIFLHVRPIQVSNNFSFFDGFPHPDLPDATTRAFPTKRGDMYHAYGAVNSYRNGTRVFRIIVPRTNSIQVAIRSSAIPAAADPGIMNGTYADNGVYCTGTMRYQGYMKRNGIYDGFYERGYSYSGINILSVARIRDDFHDIGLGYATEASTFDVTIVGTVESLTLNDLDIYVENNALRSEHIDISQSTGLELYKTDNGYVYSTRLRQPFTGHIMTFSEVPFSGLSLPEGDLRVNPGYLKTDVTYVKFGGSSLSSPDGVWMDRNQWTFKLKAIRHYDKTIYRGRSYLLSLHGRGVIVSGAKYLANDYEDGPNGYNQTDSYQTLQTYVTGVSAMTKGYGDLVISPLPIRLSWHYMKDRSDGAGWVAGTAGAIVDFVTGSSFSESEFSSIEGINSTYENRNGSIAELYSPPAAGYT